MRLDYKDLINKHKGQPCFVALHGPSLTETIKKEVQNLQLNDQMLRISVNNWFDFFDVKPDYWVVSNGEFTIKNSMMNSMIWDLHGYEKDCFNKYSVPLLYNSTADFTTQEFIDENLNCDYLSYDTRHFKQHDCKTILKNFKEHYVQNKNLDFKFYGNNSQMWQRPNVGDFPDWKKKLHGKIGSGWDAKGRCCNNIMPITLQEELQNLTGHHQHLGTSQTVGILALVFAVLMGCNPIYFAGMDLDYHKGYSDSANKRHAQNGINEGHLGHWRTAFKDFLLSDMEILKESAALMGTKILNLNEKSWYNTFEFGILPKE